MRSDYTVPRTENRFLTSRDRVGRREGLLGLLGSLGLYMILKILKALVLGAFERWIILQKEIK